MATIEEYRALKRQQRDRIDRIYTLASRGTTLADLARMYGVSRARIDQIVRTERQRRARAGEV